MRVELLFWEGCPSHPRALADLREAMKELGLDPDRIVVREVRTDADAGREHFVGSPTLGLTCRVYHRRDGRISPTPDPADVHDALAAAARTATADNQPAA
jgi:hypothetical protein